MEKQSKAKNGKARAAEVTMALMLKRWPKRPTHALHLDQHTQTHTQLDDKYDSCFPRAVCSVRENSDNSFNKTQMNRARTDLCRCDGLERSHRFSSLLLPTKHRMFVCHDEALNIHSTSYHYLKLHPFIVFDHQIQHIYPVLYTFGSIDREVTLEID